MKTIQIRTEIPGPRSRALMARRAAAVARGAHHATPLFAAKAEGAVIEDVDGNRFIDFAGGIGCLNIGHRAPRVVAWLATFNAVMLGWLLFMETDAHRLTAKLRLLITPGAYSAANLLSAAASYSQVEKLSMLITLTIAVAVLLAEWRGTECDDAQPYGLLLTMPVAPALLALTLVLGAKTFSQFVYFRF